MSSGDRCWGFNLKVLIQHDTTRAVLVSAEKSPRLCALLEHILIDVRFGLSSSVHRKKHFSHFICQNINLAISTSVLAGNKLWS